MLQGRTVSTKPDTSESKTTTSAARYWYVARQNELRHTENRPRELENEVTYNDLVVRSSTRITILEYLRESGLQLFQMNSNGLQLNAHLTQARQGNP